MRTRPPDQPIPGSPRQVAARLREALLAVRSVWFPTRRELGDWQSSRAPLYVCWTGPDRFEAGPRLTNMWAACFSPVIRGSLVEADGGTRLTWTLGWPLVTRLVVGGWLGVLLMWGLSLTWSIPSGREPAGAAVAWLVLATSAVAGIGLGQRLGGRALDEALPWMVDVASVDPVDEDF